MSLRFQRLLVILVSMILLISAVLLILFNSRQNIIFFYTPSEIPLKNLSLNSELRLGGLIEKGTYKKISKNNYVFNITDNKNSIKILYTGILPDLFREEQGVVIEGTIINKNLIKAKTVYAKHDENYMPLTVKKSLEKNQYWKKDYK